MIARFLDLDESVLLHHENKQGLISVMRKLNGRIIPNTVKDDRYVKEIGPWFWKEFKDQSSLLCGSLLCFSYLFFVPPKSKDAPGTFIWYVHLFGIYYDGEKSNIERRFGKPFPADDFTARKNSEAFIKKFMSDLTKFPDRARTHNAIVDACSALIEHDWSTGKGFNLV